MCAVFSFFKMFRMKERKKKHWVSTTVVEDQAPLPSLQLSAVVIIRRQKEISQVEKKEWRQIPGRLVPGKNLPTNSLTVQV